VPRLCEAGWWIRRIRFLFVETPLLDRRGAETLGGGVVDQENQILICQTPLLDRRGAEALEGGVVDQENQILICQTPLWIGGVPRLCEAGWWIGRIRFLFVHHPVRRSGVHPSYPGGEL